MHGIRREAAPPSVVMLLVLLSVAGPRPAAAQDTAPLSLRLAGSTRALALGDALPLGQPNSDGIFYNPAFAEGLRGFGASVQRFGAESTFLTASGASDWWRGAVAVGVRSLVYGHPAASESALRGGGATAAGEHAVSAAYAQRVRGVRLGVAAHLLQQRHGESRDETVAADVAAAFNVRFLRLGVAAQNLGPALRLNDGDVRLPATLSLQAASLSRPLGPLDILAAARVQRRLDTDRFDAGAGVEVSWWPIVGRTFSLRAGHRAAAAGDRGLALGAGFTGDRIALDYAWRELAGGPTHRLGLRLR